jgi:hypothetical protein
MVRMPPCIPSSFLDLTCKFAGHRPLCSVLSDPFWPCTPSSRLPKLPRMPSAALASPRFAAPSSPSSVQCRGDPRLKLTRSRRCLLQRRHRCSSSGIGEDLRTPPVSFPFLTCTLLALLSSYTIISCCRAPCVLPAPVSYSN